MPIYEYKCVDCGAHLEKMQRITEAPLTVCENCGGKLEKQVSRTGFQFKGEGWYVTDYAGKKSDKTEESSAGESTAKPESASKEKTDSAVKETSSKKD